MPELLVNGIKLYYEIHGEGESLLFIHGLGSSTRDWENQVFEFSQRYKVITLDLRGHGQSEKTGYRYNVPMFAADVAGLLESLGIDSAHIVGLSLGGSVAFQLAVDYPDRVKTLIVVNASPEYLVNTFKERVGVFLRFTIVYLLGMRKMGEVLSKRLFPDPEQQTIRETFVSRWAENDPQAYRATMRALLGWSVRERLNSINCATLVISAELDYTPVSSKEEYTQLIPKARLVVIPQTHHAIPVENPEAFNTTLQEFLDHHRQ